MSQVVVGIISRPSASGERQYLLVSSQDPRFGEQAGAFYPPGGHVEPGETEKQALRREIKEELCIDIVPVRRLAKTPGDVKDQTTSWWLCDYTEQQISADPKEIAEHGWFTKKQLGTLRLWPATRQFFASYLAGKYEFPDPEVLALAKIVWDYHHLYHALRPADCILVLGSHDTRVADYAAQLFLNGLAPLLILSGGLGNLTSGRWDHPEARIFADIALRMGVPEEAILIEDRSSNTGENILFTQELLASQGLDPQSFIVVQKPYMERRSYATFKRHWPDKELLVTSPPLTLEQYPTGEILLDDVITLMVGDLQRLREYPAKGFMIHQDIPAEVWQAYERLVELGFTGHLIKE